MLLNQAGDAHAAHQSAAASSSSSSSRILSQRAPVHVVSYTVPKSDAVVLPTVVGTCGLCGREPISTDPFALAHPDFAYLGDRCRVFLTQSAETECERLTNLGHEVDIRAVYEAIFTQRITVGPPRAVDTAIAASDDTGDDTRSDPDEPTDGDEDSSEDGRAPGRGRILSWR